MAESVLSRSARSGVTVVGVVLLIVGVLVSYASHTIFDEDEFAERIGRSLDDSRVSSFAAREITDAVIRESRDLMAIRPLLLVSVKAVLSSGAAQTVVRTAARGVHRLLFTDTGADILFTLDDINILVRSTLEQTHPELAERIPHQLSVRLQERLHFDSAQGPLGRWLRVLEQGRWWGALALSGGLLLLGLSAFVARRLSDGLVRLGVLLGACALSLFVVRLLGGHLLAQLTNDSELSAALVGVWDVFTIELRLWTMALGGLGLLLIAIPLGATLKAESQAAVREVWEWLIRVPEGALMRTVRALVLLLVGLLFVLIPGHALAVFAAVFGVGFAFVGFVELFSVLLLHVSGVRWMDRDELVRRLGQHSKAGGGVVVGVTAVLGVLALVTTKVPAEIYRPGVACNGMLELCDVPLDEVVFPTTHNSMAAADQPGWLVPNQEVGIARQLSDGIRGLMIDVHYGYPAQHQVLTELRDEAKAWETYEQVVGREGLEAALRIRQRLLGAPRGERGLYLCHGFCELGATPLRQDLRVIARFLEQHPREVLVIVVEDDGELESGDFVREVEGAGLDKFIYRGSIAEPWPTLEEMIERGERVLIGAEIEGGEIPWFHSVYQGLIEETPYHFVRVSDFSCEPHRGGEGAALFLLNHWITAPPAPLPSRAEVVNSEPFLMHRVLQCEKLRGRIPNLLAVDFYRTGDLFEVARILNERVVERRRVSRHP